MHVTVHTTSSISMMSIYWITFPFSSPSITFVIANFPSVEPQTLRRNFYTHEVHVRWEFFSSSRAISGGGKKVESFYECEFIMKKNRNSRMIPSNIEQVSSQIILLPRTVYSTRMRNKKLDLFTRHGGVIWMENEIPFFFAVRCAMGAWEMNRALSRLEFHLSLPRSVNIFIFTIACWWEGGDGKNIENKQRVHV